LRRKKHYYRKLEEKLKILSEKLTIEKDKLQQMSDELNKMEKNLNTAKKLVNGLADEKVRWGEEKEKLANRKDYLVGDCLLNSSFLSYLGPFTSDFRDKMINLDWKVSVAGKNIPMSPD
jgi:dynein heavy chain